MPKGKGVYLPETPVAGDMLSTQKASHDTLTHCSAHASAEHCLTCLHARPILARVCGSEAADYKACEAGQLYNQMDDV